MSAKQYLKLALTMKASLNELWVNERKKKAKGKLAMNGTENVIT